MTNPDDVGPRTRLVSTRLALAAAAVVLLQAGCTLRPDRAPAQPKAGAAASSPVLVFTHATVIDATGAPPRPGTTVVVQDRRITAVGPDDSIGLPDEARVIDATGKFLIPGLWNMHVHTTTYGPRSLAMFVQRGVTGVRDLGGDLELIDRWRAEIEEGRRLGPRIVRAGPFVDGPKELIGPPELVAERARTQIVVSDPEEARLAIQTLARGGADWVKTHNGLSAEAFRAVVAEATAAGLPVATHLAPTVTAAQASDAGVKSLEHIETLIESVIGETGRAGRKLDTLEALAELTDKRAAELFRRLRDNGTWFDPTLVAYRTFVKEAQDAVAQGRNAAKARDGREAVLRRGIELVGLMHENGVGLLAGSDSGPRPESVPYPSPEPGADLHEELVLLVEAGLTPQEALETATSKAARFLGLEGEVGTITAGSEADLVLLDRDPLADIRNTRAIVAVVLRGRLLEGAAVER